MRSLSTSRFLVHAAILAVAGLLLWSMRWMGPSDVVAAEPPGRYIVVYQAPEQIDRNVLKGHGHRVKSDFGEAGVMVINTADVSDLRNLPGVAGVALDVPGVGVPRDEIVIPMKSASNLPTGCGDTHHSCGLQWDLDRIHVPRAWKTTKGSSHVRVAVLDSGLRSTHEEVGHNYDIVHSFSTVQPNPDCAADDSTFSNIEDLSGHGTWISTHVAGRNGSLMTGIAPDVTLINGRVLSACGFGYHSWILDAMFKANEKGAQIENISLGGYVCADGVVKGSVYCGAKVNVGDGPTIWRAYRHMVDYLRRRGTLVIAAAGNEHVRLDQDGRVISAGSLAFRSASSDPANDLRGLSEVPGGVPGVIAVASVNRVTGRGTDGETLYGQYGVHARDQLTYYSSYGDRIDVSAPGGARFFNIPVFDCQDARCGALGPINTSDNSAAFGAWAFDPLGDPCDNCYVFTQGTSMAAPQVSGVAALALAASWSLTTDNLAKLLLQSVSSFSDDNATPPIASKPASPWYNFDVDYSGKAIHNQLMGTGVIDAAQAVMGEPGH